MFSKVLWWIPLAIVITGLSGLVYVVEQQNLRQNANDPQIQMAEDLANTLSTKHTSFKGNLTPTIDISKSLAPYFILYDESGNVISGTGSLDGQVPKVPVGVLNYAKSHGENRITWQPRNGVRSAIVVVPFNGDSKGFVMAGKSLLEVEEREEKLLHMVVVAWVATMAGSLVAVVAVAMLTKKSKK